MTITILPAEDADMTALFTIGSRAFAFNEPFWDATYPEHDTDAGRVKGGQRFLDIKHSDLNCHYLKAVDEETREIVGFARWLVYKNRIPGPSDAGKHWDDPEEEEYAQHLLNEFVKARNAHIAQTGGNVVSLDICAVDPSHQRRGIGGKLVAWGTQKADDMGVESVVESSRFGKALYEKNGYIFERDVVLQVPEKWADRPKAGYAWLVRPKKTA